MGKLTIKFKLLGMIIMTVLLLLSGLSLTVWVNMKSMALETHEDNAKIELRLLAQYIEQVIGAASETTLLLAESSALKEAIPTFPKFFEPGTGDSIVTPSPYDIKAQVYKNWADVKKTHPNVSCVFMGAEDGGFYMYPEGKLGRGYDPRTRTWYKQAKSSSRDLVLTSSYMSTTGEAVVNTIARVRGNGGTLGYIGLDIGLGTLTEKIGSVAIGKSGYVLLMEQSGVIVADPRHKDFVFKNADETGEQGLVAVKNSKGGMFESNMDGKSTLVTVLDLPEINIKLAMFIDYDEVMASAKNTQFVILGIGIALSLVLLVFGLLVSRSIVRPIGLMVGAAEDIAQGNYDNVPDNSNFGGELLRLHLAMAEMVGSLVEALQTSKVKSEEAEEKSRQAEVAMNEAEQARLEAENAKRDGMLQAAGQLEGIAAQVGSASQELASQIEQSNQGTSIQQERTSEAATAMEEMNASVLEVAQNASSAAENADSAKDTAVEGGKIVDQVINAINGVQEESIRMKDGLDELGQRAEGIGQVMNVITDIADQTNLLALNAAIEAARAGDAGRGFAVVADEVRKLAEKTMTATKEVGDAVRAIQSSSERNIEDMNRSVEAVGQSTELASQAGESLTSIVNIIEGTADQVRAIATASEQQSSASEEISRGTSEVNRIASETSSAMEQSANAVDELAQLAGQLQNIIVELKSE